MIHVEIEDTGVQQRLQVAVDRLSNMRPLMQNIGKHMETSVLENINQGGRPELWKKNIFGNPLLNKMGGLKRSVKIGTLTNSEVEIVAGGSAAPYAIYHHFGKTYKPTAGQRRFFFWLLRHTGIYNKSYIRGSGVFSIPQRRFMLFRTEDIEFITNEFQKHINGER